MDVRGGRNTILQIIQSFSKPSNLHIYVEVFMDFEDFVTVYFRLCLPI